MPDMTARFALPHILPGQAQKELYHNEALARIDALLHAAVEDIGLDVPPGAPQPGQAWIVGAAPSGDWAGQADTLAVWTEGGWRFVVPRAGTTIYIAADDIHGRYDGSQWIVGRIQGNALIVNGEQVVGPRGPAIADLASGDDPVPAFNAMLAVLRSHGLIEN